MADLEQFESEQRRLEILRLLAADDDYTLNEDLLNRCLGDLGLKTSSARLHADLLHLKSHGAVKIEIKGQDLYVATITPFGVEVSQGQERIPGVAKPKPGRNS